MTTSDPLLRTIDRLRDELLAGLPDDLTNDQRGKIYGTTWRLFDEAKAGLLQAVEVGQIRELPGELPILEAVIRNPWEPHRRGFPYVD